jgi:molybdenum cofactor cytidylyltransferase
MDAAVGAVVLAAGLSTRMGQPKLILPWGETTIIGRVVQVLHAAEVQPVIVVTGGAHQQVETALQGMPVKAVFNPRYADDYMALSLKIGLSQLPETVDASLVVLGDQPQIRCDLVQAILERYRGNSQALIVPSYQNRRGHPWLVHRSLWAEILVLQPPDTLRNWMNSHSASIHYIEAQDDSILRDLDTPQDYQREIRGQSAGTVITK